MPSLSPSRPSGRDRDLDLAALGRFMPAIDADPDRGFRCPNTPPWVKPHECYEDGWKISPGARAFRSARSPVLLDDSCREFYDTAVRATDELENSIEDRMTKIRELNAILREDQRFFPVQTMVRDDVEPLRNYVFIRTRENPCEVKPGSSMLPLICPLRGMSLHFDSMVEYALKVKLGGGDSTGDDEDAILIDGCIQYRKESIRRDVKLKSRIDGPFGPVNMEYAFIRHDVEAAVQITLPSYLAGDLVKLTAFTSGYADPIVLYDGRVRKRSKVTSLLAVSVGGQLKVRLEATIAACGGEPRGCVDVEKDVVFTAQEFGRSNGNSEWLICL